MIRLIIAMYNYSLDSKLILIIGPMFSSKTSTLLERARLYEKTLGQPVLLISPSRDNRPEGETIGTHDGILETAMKLDDIRDIKKQDLLGYAVYGIDEAQFFTSGLEEVVQWLLDNRKIVIVAGLNADSDQRNFGDLSKLVSIADTIEHKKALCYICKNGKPASHTKHIIGDKRGQIDVGGSDKYIPVCRQCLTSDKKG